jgi:hypothetical protein
MFDLGGELGRLLQIRRKRFLAQHRQSAFRGEPHQCRVHPARGCDIDGVDLAGSEHGFGISESF